MTTLATIHIAKKQLGLHAVEIPPLHEGGFRCVLVGQLVELGLLAELEDEGLQRLGRVEQEPGRAGAGLHVGDGAQGAVRLGADRMVFVEEVLAVVALQSETGGQRRPDEFVRPARGCAPHSGEARRIDPDIVVIDVVGLDGDRAFERTIAQLVAVAGQLLHEPLADPLPQGGPLTQPAVFVLGRGRRDFLRHHVPARRHVAKTLLGSVAESGRPLTFILASGIVLGRWCLEEVIKDERLIEGWGYPGEIGFELRLTLYAGGFAWPF